MPSRALADIPRPPTHRNVTIMSPAEALYVTSRGPTRSVAFIGRRPDLAETIERRTEDLDETSNCPIALDGREEPRTTPGTALRRSRTRPSGALEESSVQQERGRPRSGPSQDRCETRIGPTQDRAATPRAVLRGLGAAFDPVGTWNFADVAAGFREPPLWGGERSLRVPRSGRLPAQRPPEGPGHSGAERVNVLRGYDIPCLGVPEAPTTGCRGPVVGGHAETWNVALDRWSGPRSGKGSRPSIKRCRAVPPGTTRRPKSSEQGKRGITVSEQTGHAAFHLRHVAHGTSGNRADRRAILHESMRHLNAKDVARHAARNLSIVPAEAHSNAAFVNDGAGGFCSAKTVKEVLDYGDARQKRVRRKINEKQVTTNLFVVHLPKTMCVEIPNYYPRLNADGSERLDPATGEPMSRSRWVARDQDEAMRYFRDAIDRLGSHIVPGGQEAIHGWATNFDESTPHIQIMADPFAPDPRAPEDQPDALRTEHNQAYGSHREVTDERGRQISGPAKMRDHQAGFRAHLVALGWPVEQEVSARHGKELSKPEFEAAMDAAAEARAALEGARARSKANSQKVAAFTAKVAAVKDGFDARAAELDEREGILERREAELPRLRRQVVEKTKAEVRQECYETELAAAKARADEALKLFLERLRSQRTPQLFEEFLDRKDKRGRSYRPIFELFIDQRLKHFEAAHGVTGELVLDPGERERFLKDGGQKLAAEVAQLQRDREYGS